jgi:hypothetical protein
MDISENLLLPFGPTSYAPTAFRGLFVRIAREGSPWESVGTISDGRTGPHKFERTGNAGVNLEPSTRLLGVYLRGTPGFGIEGENLAICLNLAGEALDLIDSRAGVTFTGFAHKEDSGIDTLLKFPEPIGTIAFKTFWTRNHSPKELERIAAIAQKITQNLTGLFSVKGSR